MGALILVGVMAAAAVFHLTHSKLSSNTTALLADLFLASFPVIVVGTWAGYYIRETKNGRAALLVGCAAIIVFGSIYLLPVLLGHF